MITLKSVNVRLNGLVLANHRSLTLVAGPCVLESEAHALSVAKQLARLAREHHLPFIFKASYDKANRTSLRSFRGPGLEKGLAVLARVKREVGCPVLTDVHCKEEAPVVAQVADILQIPAFLCRQTDLLLACGRTGKVVNIKKGPFIAPWDVRPIVEKIESTGNRRILLTERGTTFGYNNLVVDMRSLAILKGIGYPVIYDATHSVQLPGGLGHASGGQREFVMPLTRAAVALGLAGLFCEVHPHPDRAPSDGPNSLAMASLPRYFKTVASLDRWAKRN